MKAYLSVDMEGVAGVSSWGEVLDPAHPSNREARERMTREVNAALDELFRQGVTEAVVNDAHHSMRNLIPELLDRRARLLAGTPKPWSMVDGVEEGFDLGLFLGYHAMGGAEGVLSHTYSVDPLVVRLNGLALGETGLNALVLGSYGVPVVLVSGDDRLAEEVRGILPWAETVTVKEARGRVAALSLHPEAAQAAIRNGVAAAFRRRDAWQPLRLEEPVTLELELLQAAMAEVALLIPDMVREGPRHVRYVARDVRTAVRVVRAVVTLARTVRD
jgi:D-amino peptidase